VRPNPFRHNQLPKNKKHIRFISEREMTAYFVNNLGQIEYGLTLYQDEDTTGVEFNLYGGNGATAPRIDILAIDAQGTYVVIECKIFHAAHLVAGQVASYVSILRERILPMHSRVRAIILCQKPSPLLWYAIREIPGIEIAVYAYGGPEGVRRLTSPIGLKQLQLEL
jgi:RecB family endonuclease NucS